MTITNGYIGAQEAQAYIGRQFADGTGILDSIVTVASRSIDRHCGRHFYQHGTTEVPVARYFDTWGDTLTLGTYNDLVSVSTLKGDDDDTGTYETTYTNYQLLPKGAATRQPDAEPFTKTRLLDTDTFPVLDNSGRTGLIEVTGVWGWPSVPADIVAACRILVAELGKLQDAPLGMLGSAEFGMSRIPPQKQRHVREMLAPFVHPQHVGIA